MKIKVSDLSGRALDQLVAQCVIARGGYPVYLRSDPTTCGAPYTPHWGESGHSERFRPSTRGDHGAPIIDRENITVIRANDDYETDAKGFTTNKRIPQWFAETSRWTGHSLTTSYEGESMDPTFLIAESGGYYGPTHLVAAMRALVARELGDEIDVPEELL